MKIALSGDWHWGRSNGDESHNRDLLNFVHFMISQCRKRGVTDFHFLGDWYDNRAKIDLPSLNYSTQAIRELTDYFGRYIHLVGNHDMFYKDRHDVTSVEPYRERVTLVDTHLIVDDRMYVSWLCNQQEYDEVIELSKKHKIRYMFMHAEFGGFQMNDHYTSHGSSHRELKHVKQIFTGHYHGPQRKDNVLYLGGPIPMDMNDANSEDGVGEVRGRGFWILDTDTGEIERVFYDAVKVVSVTADQFLKGDYAKQADQNTTIRVVIDRELSDDEATILQTALEESEFRSSKVVTTINLVKDMVEQDVEMNGDVQLLDVDQAVVAAIENMDTNTDTIRKDELVKLYEEAIAA